MDIIILTKFQKSSGQTYVLSQHGEITSSKSSLSRILIFSIILFIFGCIVFVKSVIILNSKSEYLSVVVTKAYYTAPAGIGIVASGILIMITAYFRPQKVLLLDDRIEVTNKLSNFSAKWQDVGQFKPDTLGLSVSARYIDPKTNKESGDTLRVPLVGSNAAEFAETLNLFKEKKLSKI